MHMDSDFYAKKSQQCSRTLPHTKRSKPAKYQVMNIIKTLIGKHKKNLTDKDIDYLTNFEIKCSNLYGLPKVQKVNKLKRQSKSVTLSTWI